MEFPDPKAFSYLGNEEYFAEIIAFAQKHFGRENPSCSLGELYSMKKKYTLEGHLFMSVLSEGRFNCPFVDHINELSSRQGDRRIPTDVDHEEELRIGAELLYLTIDDFGLFGFKNRGPILRHDTVAQFLAWSGSTIIDDTIGCLYFLPAHRHLSFNRWQKSVEAVLKLNVPVIIVADYQEKPLALAPWQIRQLFNIPDNIPVLPHVSNNEVFSWRILIEFLRHSSKSDLVERALEKVTTSERMAIDLARYDNKPEIQWFPLGVFLAGNKYWGHLFSTLHHEGYNRFGIHNHTQLYLFGGRIEFSEQRIRTLESGQTPYDYYSESPVGYVFIISIIQPDCFPDVEEILKIMPTLTQKPYVVILDRQNDPQSVIPTPETQQMPVIPPQIPVIVCDTVDETIMTRALWALYAQNPHDPSLSKFYHATH